MTDYIRLHREEFGVEPICRVLSEHGIKIAPSTYYDQVSRRPSRRYLRDVQIVEAINDQPAGLVIDSTSSTSSSFSSEMAPDVTCPRSITTSRIVLRSASACLAILAASS